MMNYVSLVKVMSLHMGDCGLTQVIYQWFEDGSVFSQNYGQNVWSTTNLLPLLWHEQVFGIYDCWVGNSESRELVKFFRCLRHSASSMLGQ